MCAWGGNFLPLTPIVEGSEGFRKVQSGLEFILRHFSQPLFIRKISTVKTENRQKPVQDIASAMNEFQEASWLDCRIAAFGVNQTNPDVLFIDLDARDFASLRSFKLALTATLKTIEKKLDGAHPTVLWSGRGFHIIQPIDCPVNLDNIKEFAGMTENPNNKFLQFAERYLSNGRCDRANNPAMRSCMLRIPHSYNTKNKAEVTIIHRWDGHRPDYRLLIGSFYADLVDQYHKQKFSSRFKAQQRCCTTSTISGKGIPEPYIEKLLKTPIADYRKHARDLILVPYLVVRKGMTNPDQIYDIVMQWADKCAELKRLEPSRHEFASRLRSRIKEVMQSRVPPMQFETLREKNPDLYRRLNPD